MLSIHFEEHPLFAPRAFVSTFPAAVGETPSLDWLTAYFQACEVCPSPADQALRDRVRALLRWGGFKPSGRSKPASEFLVRAHEQQSLSSINLAVDLGNVVSLWSGFPITVVDLSLCQQPLSLKVVREKVGYVFNPSGQELDLEGLLCLWDAHGPCGSPVKDSQRSKTTPATTQTLCLIWGERSVLPALENTLAWYRELSQRAGASLGEVEFRALA